MNQTQGLGTVSYSVAHNEVLEKSERQRVATQLTLIIKEVLKRNNFNSLKILDVGCSSGVITQFISRYGGHAIGIDVDESAIQNAKINYKDTKNLSFQVASGSNLPFKNTSFDIVVCNQVYSYASNSEKMMKEIYRVLKPDGFCLFTGDNLLRPIEPLYNFPFLRYVPKNSARYILKITGHKQIFIGNYKTYWGLLKLCDNFTIEDYTLKVLKQPKKFKYTKIVKYKRLVNMIPFFILKLLEPFLPSFIFILKKGSA